MRFSELTKKLVNIISMSRRRSASPATSPRPAKRAKLDHLTSNDFKGGVFLAPMVRSGACKLLLPGCRLSDGIAISVYE